jgi:RNA polymerase sigma-70 factor (ECF subfamily)
MSTAGDPTLAAEWSSAFDEVVAVHHPDMLRLAYGLVGDGPMAADVVQAAWTAAWQHRSELRDPEKIRSWLLTITANQARKALRWRSVRRWLPLGTAPEPAAPPVRHEEHLDLVAMLQALPTRDRQILLLRHVLGETSAEIGRQVGLSESGVRVRLSRLLAQLRKDLTDD